MTEQILAHEDIELLANSILGWAHEFVSLVKADKEDEDWQREFGLYIKEAINYNAVINSYKDNSSLPRPDTCMHVEILYVMQMFTELQERAAELAALQMETLGELVNDSYAALALNMQMNLAIRWILALEKKMQMRRDGLNAVFEDLLNEMREQF